MHNQKNIFDLLFGFERAQDSPLTSQDPKQVPPTNAIVKKHTKLYLL